MFMTTLGVAVATCALAGAPAPGHGIYSEVLSGIPLQNGNLLVAKPYPDNRTSTTTYTNSGRLWVPYTAQEKILSSLAPGGGPATIGAPLHAGHLTNGLGHYSGHGAVVAEPIAPGDVVIFIRPQSEPWPDIAITPNQEINEATIDAITRRHPWLKRSPERTRDMIEELRAAQRRYLRQQGYVAGVRTHVNPLALRRHAPGEKSTTSGEVEPSATIRLRPVTPAPEKELRTSVPLEDSTVRVSLPGGATPRPQITVVRQESEPAPGAGEQS
jgi:hypothetical protein